MELWEELNEAGFPDHSVSSYGRVCNERTGRMLRQTFNTSGHLKVGMINPEGERKTLMVARLVAGAFLPKPSIAFDTPIYLDGNREHVYVDNLEWRPRWFAVKYNAQFKSRKKPSVNAQLEWIEMGEVFDNSRDAAIKYGLLERDIQLDLTNQRGVFPTGQQFRLI